MIPSMVSGCFECERLLKTYEAATFEQARIHNAMDIAGCMRDAFETRRLTLDAFAVTNRRRTARAAMKQHYREAHQVAAGAAVLQVA
jgi:hypothetical protein